jgi:hypothetical protein
MFLPSVMAPCNFSPKAVTHSVEGVLIVEFTVLLWLTLKAEPKTKSTDGLLGRLDQEAHMPREGKER